MGTHRDGSAPGQVIVQCRQRADRDHIQIGDQRSFGRVRFGYHDAFETGLAAVAAIGSTPRACRTAPSSEGSPTTIPSVVSAGNVPI